MDFKMAYTVLGGLGLFFLGMKFLSESLQAIAGDMIRKIINWLTTNRVLALLVGTLVTMIVQSSSVTTVMVVGMVNAGLMQLTQAIGVIFGANIGTTITGWIIAVKIGKYGLAFIGAGILPMLFAKNEKVKGSAKVLLSLGLVFLGLQTMSGAFKPLRSDPEFIEMLHYFTADNYLSVIGCVAVGCFLTMIIQSSSAMLGITIALAGSGVISFQTGMALVLGENIGTTITALLASVGTNTNAKRAARAHAMFNVFGVFVMTLIFWHYVDFIEYVIPGAANAVDAEGNKPNIAKHLAMGHTIFNVTASIIFLPFIGYLAKTVIWLTPDKKGKEVERLKSLGTTSQAPALGLDQTEKELYVMFDKLQDQMAKAKSYIGLEMDEPKLLDDISRIEDEIDIDQKDVTLFVCNLMTSPLTPEQSSKSYSYIRIADEIESISDYIFLVAKHYSKTISDKERRITGKAREEISELFQTALTYIDEVRTLLHDLNPALLTELRSKGKSFNQQAKRIRDDHLNRMKSGECSPLGGLAFSDLVVLTRRIKNHTVNIIDAIEGSSSELKDAG